jgi:hypothetical protein
MQKQPSVINGCIGKCDIQLAKAIRSLLSAGFTQATENGHTQPAG